MNFWKRHAGLNINKQFIKTKRLINPDKRIIIYNVPPSIPHDDITELIKSFDIKLSFDITFVKFGIKDDEFSRLQFHSLDR